MGRKLENFWHFLGYYAVVWRFLGRNSRNDTQKFSKLAVSKILGAASSLPNLTIIGAHSRPYGATNQKRPTKVILIPAFLPVKTLVFSFSCRCAFIILHQTLHADRGR